jgi:hypothetical protein
LTVKESSVEQIRLLLLVVYALGFIVSLLSLLVPSLLDGSWAERVPLLRALFSAYAVIGGIIWAGRFGAHSAPDRPAPSTWVIVLATAIGYNLAFLIPSVLYVFQFKTGTLWLKSSTLEEYLNWLLVAGVAGTYPLLDFFKKPDDKDVGMPAGTSRK